MKKSMLTAVLLSFMVSCSEEAIVGSGNIVSEEREVISFSRISSEGVIDMEITQGDSQFIEITADDNVIDRVRTKVNNGELSLYLDGDSFKNIQVRAVLRVKSLTAIRNIGTGDISARDFNGNENFNLYNSGTGNIELTGSATSLTLENEGTGTISAFGFPVRQADLTLIGSGDCEVHCTESMNVFIDGSGNVYYKGNPSIQISVEGSGEVINSN